MFLTSRDKFYSFFIVDDGQPCAHLCTLQAHESRVKRPLSIRAEWHDTNNISMLLIFYCNYATNELQAAKIAKNYSEIHFISFAVCKTSLFFNQYIYLIPFIKYTSWNFLILIGTRKSDRQGKTCKNRTLSRNHHSNHMTCSEIMLNASVVKAFLFMRFKFAYVTYSR